MRSAPPRGPMTVPLVPVRLGITHTHQTRKLVLRALRLTTPKSVLPIRAPLRWTAVRVDAILVTPFKWASQGAWIIARRTPVRALSQRTGRTKHTRTLSRPRLKWPVVQRQRSNVAAGTAGIEEPLPCPASPGPSHLIAMCASTMTRALAGPMIARVLVTSARPQAPAHTVAPAQPTPTGMHCR